MNILAIFYFTLRFCVGSLLVVVNLKKHVAKFEKRRKISGCVRRKKRPSVFIYKFTTSLRGYMMRTAYRIRAIE